MARDDNARGARKGVSLAKGPVGILGLIGILYGLSALIFWGHGFAVHIPHGAVHGKKWIGVEVNGWSDLLFIAAGLALLLSAPLHWGAKSMSMLVGVVMIVAAIIAIIRGDGVFGIFAANHLTELVWGAAGVLLMVLALLPRVGGREGRDEPERAGATAALRSNVTRGQARPVNRDSAATVERGSGTTVERDSGTRSRRLIRRRTSTPNAEATDQHVRWLQNAESQDRPPGADAQRTDNPESRKGDL